MKITKNMVVSDLHIHSKYSRGCSKSMDIDNLSKWAKIKGLNLLGTGDFTHPEWIKELKERLVDDGTGVFRHKNNGFKFVLQTEISLIYSQEGKGRRVHLIVLAPDFESVDKITKYLLGFGRVDYDGRPIFKIPCYKFTKDLMDINSRIEIIPAHVWTPHFSLFGEYNQFSKVEDAFKEMSKHIHAFETGISSDPKMNRRISYNDKYNMVSFSDCHSYWPWRLGREATVFELGDLTYDNLINAIRTGDGLVGTIESDPNFGKYHYDGHRKCNVIMKPFESMKAKGLCPKCGKKMTIGVVNRIERLIDRDKGTCNDQFLTLLPLSEIVAKYLDKGVSTKSVWNIYNKLIDKFENEFNVLINVSKEDLLEVIDEKLVGYILKNRDGKIDIFPGYDGEYGIILLEKEDHDKIIGFTQAKNMQKCLGDF